MSCGLIANFGVRDGWGRLWGGLVLVPIPSVRRLFEYCNAQHECHAPRPGSGHRRSPARQPRASVVAAADPGRRDALPADRYPPLQRDLAKALCKHWRRRICADEAVDHCWPHGVQEPIRGQHGLRLRLDLQNWADRRSYFNGRYYQPDISRLLETLLQPGDQYVDVGANIGMTALLARSRIGSEGKGLAFEPNPAAFARLKDHFELNRIANFQLVPCALADRESVQVLYVPLDDLLLGTIVPEKAEGTRVEIRTVPADPYVVGFDPSTPTLIKIDVEGYEVQVLQGLRSLLAWPDVMLVIEIADAKLRRAGHSRDELHALLASYGLVAHTIHVRSSRWRKES